MGFNRRELLGELRLPVLCLAGEHDRNAPPALMQQMAARIAGACLWVIGYIVWPAVLTAKYGMSITLLFVCIGYGLVETQLAAHVGALLWGKAKGRPGPV